MNFKISAGAALALLLVVAMAVFSITMKFATDRFNTRVSDLRSREAVLDKYAEINRLVRNYYYTDFNEPLMLDSLARGYIEGIGDKYSRYLTADEYKRLTQDSTGDNVDIGAVVEVSADDFYLLVKEVYPDSPAEVAGIQAGDLIINIDETDLTRENSRQMLESLQGPAGSKITVITRRGTTDSAPTEMTRRAVAVPTVLYSRLLEDSSVGYVHIKEFGERTYDQFNRELIRLIELNATSLVIDLRDNQSDNLNSATRILDKLLPDGVLVSAVYKDGRTEVLRTSDANQIDLPIVVLTNANTAGISEVFAQAIKDFERGRTVGTTTAGKGVMQTTLKLEDGSAIQLSVATYVTQSGLSFNAVGVKSDFEVAMDTDWTKLVLAEAADPQLAKAKEVALSLESTDPNAQSAAEQPAEGAEGPSSGETAASESTGSESSAASTSSEGEGEETSGEGSDGDSESESGSDSDSEESSEGSSETDE